MEVLQSNWQRFTGGHYIINHIVGEFTNGFIFTNTAESSLALLNPGVLGISHHFSKWHLGRYGNEFSFQWNHRKISDGEKMVTAIVGSVGKRLIYRPVRGLSRCLISQKGVKNHKAIEAANQDCYTKKNHAHS